MTLFDLIAAERVQLLQALDRCVRGAESARITRTDSAAAANALLHVRRYGRIVVTELAARAAGKARELIARQSMAASLAATAVAEREAGGADVSSGLKRLHDALRALERHERDASIALMREHFDESELRRLAGAWRLDTLPSAHMGHVQKLAGTARRWLRSVLPGRVPVLRDAVFVYRGSDARSRA